MRAFDSIDDVCYLPASELAAAIRARTLSPVEVLDALAARIERVNPTLNAFCTLALDEARAAAQAAEQARSQGQAAGPLHGVPVAIKDDLGVAGLRFTEGSRLHAARVADADDFTVQRLKAAGAIVLGKTNEPEFGHKGITDNLLFGPTRNPWRLDVTPGGSSGGSAAAVAAGLAYLALGTDGGGSVRIPASFCGIVGHKPSLGRVPRVPAPNAWVTTWVIGPLARTVADAALALRVLAGPDERDPFALPAWDDAESALDGELRGLRVAWSPSIDAAPVEEAVARAGLEVLRALTDRAAAVEQIDFAPRAPRDAWTDLWTAGYADSLGADLDRIRADLTPTLAAMVEQGQSVTLRRYLAAEQEVSRFVERMASVFDRYDLVATPTTPLPAFSLDLPLGPERIGDTPVTPRPGWAFTWPFNLTGQPAVSIPCGWSETPGSENGDGGTESDERSARQPLPYGLQLIGRRRADGLVLRAAAAIERARPWAGRRPPLTTL